MDLSLDHSNFESLVQHLGDRVRSKQAFWRLVGSGSPALAAVRQGLTDSNAEVRMHCARVLDHLVDDDAWPELIRMLDDPDPRVRVHTLHAIACDRCKQDTCGPSKADVLPRVIAILGNDPFHHVRQMAVEVVALWVHDDSEASAALVAARDDDSNPSVRKKAGWNAPGGVIFKKSARERQRATRSRR